MDFDAPEHAETTATPASGLLLRLRLAAYTLLRRLRGECELPETAVAAVPAVIEDPRLERAWRNVGDALDQRLEAIRAMHGGGPEAST